MDENSYEKLLNIKTSKDRNKSNNSLHYNIYEPTSYFALDTLFNNYSLDSKDKIIDYGCGKGRLNFYLNYKFNVSVTGIEMNTFYYNEALQNKTSYLSKHKKSDKLINFENVLAQNYNIEADDNVFYFFNPFSVEIFITVINKIITSLYEHERKITIILYYPLEDYIFYLNNTLFTLHKEIRVPKYYEKDNNFRFLIYTN